MFYASAVAWLLIGTLLAGIYLVQDALARFSRRALSFLTWGRIRPAHVNAMHLRLGIDGRNGNGHLADGPPLPDDVAASASARDGRGFWNLGVLLGVGGDSRWATAPVMNGSSFRRYAAIVLFVAYLLIMIVGVAHVPLPARRSYLHHAMVFARRVSLVPVALRRRAD